MIIHWRQKILRFLRKRAQQSSRELNNARAYTGFAWGLQFFSNEIWETCTRGAKQGGVGGVSTPPEFWMGGLSTCQPPLILRKNFLGGVGSP